MNGDSRLCAGWTQETVSRSPPSSGGQPLISDTDHAYNVQATPTMYRPHLQRTGHAYNWQAMPTPTTAWKQHAQQTRYSPEVARNDVRCKTSSRYLVPSLKKGKCKRADLGSSPNRLTSPFSALPAQRIWPANETMSYDRASATCVCVNTHTVVLHFFIWITVMLLVKRL